GDAARLSHSGLQAWGVDDVFPATAGVGLQMRGLQVHHPDLVRACHSNKQLRAEAYQIPGGIQGDLRGCARHIKSARLLASPSDGGDGSGLQVEPTQQMVLGIGNVQELSVQGHALWMMKCGRVKVPISSADSSTASHGEHLALQVSDNNAVI